MNGIAIIPARGGSKGIPRKNIRSFCGQPLIKYSIDVAKKSKYIRNVYVTTEDEEIARLAVQLGAEVPWLRPVSLAQDDTLTVDVLRDFLHTFRRRLSNAVDFVVLLQPTSPLRSVEDVDAAINLFTSSRCDQVVSVVQPKHHPNWCYQDQDGYLVRLMEESLASRRQDLSSAYALNGAVYVYSPEVIENDSQHPPLTKYIEMPTLRSMDIDTSTDFELAELIMARYILREKEGV